MAENQHGSFVVDGGKSYFDPVTYRIFMTAEQLGHLFRCVASVNFNETVVRVTFSHRLVDLSLGRGSWRVFLLAELPASYHALFLYLSPQVCNKVTIGWYI